jgi:vacuolar protein sorting-associated protein 53
LRKINEESAELVDKISSVKVKAEMSEEMVKSICSEIRSLDFAKKNITFTLKAMK